MKMADHGCYLYSQILKFQKTIYFEKNIKDLFPETIQLPKTQKKLKQFLGLYSFLPENDCLMIIKFTFNKKSNSAEIEFSCLEDPNTENINKYKYICKVILDDIEFYLRLKV